MICGTCLLNIIRGCLIFCFSFTVFDCCPCKNNKLKFRFLGKLEVEWFYPFCQTCERIMHLLNLSEKEAMREGMFWVQPEKDSSCWVECHSSIHLYSQILLQSFVLCSFLKLVLRKLDDQDGKQGQNSFLNMSLLSFFSPWQNLNNDNHPRIFFLYCSSVIIKGC